MLSTVWKWILGFCCIVALLFLGRYRFAQPLFAQYLSRQVQIDISNSYGDAEILGMRIHDNLFTVEAKEYDKIIYGRYVCHFRCRQTDLYVVQDGIWGFIVQQTEDTSRLDSAGMP
jgi:hypothetical protein